MIRTVIVNREWRRSEDSYGGVAELQQSHGAVTEVTD